MGGEPPTHVQPVIVTMPERRNIAERLARVLPGCIVSCRPDLNLQEGYMAALDEALATNPAWVVFFTDDTIVCRNFWPKALRRISEAMLNKGACVLFYNARQESADAHAAGKRWLKVQHPHVYDLGIAMPAAGVRAMLKWAREPAQRATKGYETWGDHMFGSFLKAVGVPAWCTIPNLTDHDSALPSVVGHAQQAGGYVRKSRTFSPEAE